MKNPARIAMLLAATLCIAGGAMSAHANVDDQVSLNVPFDPDEESYSATVPNDVTEITDEASARHPSARVTVNGGDPDTPVQLAVGGERHHGGGDGGGPALPADLHGDGDPRGGGGDGDCGDAGGVDLRRRGGDRGRQRHVHRHGEPGAFGGAHGRCDGEPERRPCRFGRDRLADGDGADRGHGERSRWRRWTTRRTRRTAR